MAEPNNPKSLQQILADFMLQDVPSYANKIYYSLGFLSMTSFFVLLASGLVLVFHGPDWWLTTSMGLYFRSVHLWATQAFIFFILLHILIVFLTSGYKKPRRLTWVLGSLLFFTSLAEAEFGYGLRGDFSSQWRTLQASDLYNGSGLGAFINNLNYAQIYGIHIAIIPIVLLGILFMHYVLVKVRGIATPSRPEANYTIVKADHTKLFLRGGVLIAVILLLSVFFKSPLIIPTTIKDVAVTDPALAAKTFLSELDHTSDTATYLDNIDPYAYDTKEIYIFGPYQEYIQLGNFPDVLAVLNSETGDQQQTDIKSAGDYFANSGILDINSKNPAVVVVSSLVKMAQSGLYETSLRGSSSNAYDPTYATRFLSDTGVLEDKANGLAITTDQYGMLREEHGLLPPGAWWLLPVGLLDHTILANDVNQDRDGAEILGLLMLLFVAFPYLPYVNRIPEKLSIDKFIRRE